MGVLLVVVDISVGVRMMRVMTANSILIFQYHPIGTQPQGKSNEMVNWEWSECVMRLPVPLLRC